MDRTEHCSHARCQSCDVKLIDAGAIRGIPMLGKLLRAHLDKPDIVMMMFEAQAQNFFGNSLSRIMCVEHGIIPLIKKILQTHLGNTAVTECLLKTLIALTDSSADSRIIVRQVIENADIFQAIVSSFEASMDSVHAIRLFSALICQWLGISCCFNGIKYVDHDDFHIVRSAILNSSVVEVLLKCLQLHKNTAHVLLFEFYINSIFLMLTASKDDDDSRLSVVFQNLSSSYRRGESNRKHDPQVCLTLLLSAKDSNSRCKNMVDSNVLSALIGVIQFKRRNFVSEALPAALSVIISTLSGDQFKLIMKDVEKCLVECIDTEKITQTENSFVALNALYGHPCFDHSGFILDFRKRRFCLLFKYPYICFLSCQLIETSLNAYVHSHGAHCLVKILEGIAREHPDNGQINYTIARIISNMLRTKSRQAICGCFKGRGSSNIMNNTRQLLVSDLFDDQMCAWYCSVIGHLASSLNSEERYRCFVAVNHAFKVRILSDASAQIIFAGIQLAKHSRQLYGAKQEMRNFERLKDLSIIIAASILIEERKDVLTKLETAANVLDVYISPLGNTLIENLKSAFM